MESDEIIEIGIDAEERLYVKPSIAKFPMMYREAIEVHWNESGGYLYGAQPRKWSYIDWYKHIVSGASMQGFELRQTNKMRWVNIPAELQKQIMAQENASST